MNRIDECLALRNSQLEEMAMLIEKLAHSLKKANPDSDLPDRAVDYLKRNSLQGSPLR